MKCLRCNFENSDDVKFCANCGTKIEENTEKSNNVEPQNTIFQQPTNNFNQPMNNYQQPNNNFNQPMNNYQQPNNFNQTNINKPQKSKTGLIIGIIIGIISLAAIVVLMFFLLSDSKNKTLTCTIELSKVEKSYDLVGTGTMTMKAKFDSDDMVNEADLIISLKVSDSNNIEIAKESFEKYCKASDLQSCNVSVKSNVVEISAIINSQQNETREQFLEETKELGMTCE